MKENIVQGMDSRTFFYKIVVQYLRSNSQSLSFEFFVETLIGLTPGELAAGMPPEMFEGKQGRRHKM